MDNNQQNNCGCSKNHHGRAYHIVMLCMMGFITLLLLMVLCGVYRNQDNGMGYGKMMGLKKGQHMMAEMREEMQELRAEIEEIKGTKGAK